MFHHQNNKSVLLHPAVLTKTKTKVAHEIKKKKSHEALFKLQTHAPDNTTPRAVSNPPAHPIPLFSPSSADSPFFSRSRHLGAYVNVLKICRGSPPSPPPSLPMQKCLLHHVVLDASYYTPPLFHPSNGRSRSESPSFPKLAVFAVSFTAQAVIAAASVLVL